MSQKARNNKRSHNNVFYIEDEKIAKTSLTLKTFEPVTENQVRTFKSYQKQRHLMLYGVAGTGKTFVALYLALNEILRTKSHYHKIIIVRSVVPSRDIGFLPGTVNQKAEIYELPYKDLCAELFGRSDAHEILKKKGVIEHLTTSFIRGTTLNNAIIIVDECQNMNDHELNTVATRPGDRSRIIFSGDIRQTDLSSSRDHSGLFDFMKIVKEMDTFDFIEFDINDIVRSGFVKDYIIKRTELEDKGLISTL